MFGVSLASGNMSVAAAGQGDLIVRGPPEDTDELLAKAHAFLMRDRAIKGRVRVEAEGARTKRQLEHWVRRGGAYARSLPSKR